VENLSWINEIDVSKHLDEDSMLIVEECGFDVYIKLQSILGNSRIYLSGKPLLKMKKAYIKKHKEKSVRELQRILKVSEQFIIRAKASD